MGAWGVVVLVVGALVLAIASETIGSRRPGWEFLVVAAGAVIGGFVASEWLGDAGTWGWEVDGLFVFSALIGAVIVGGLVEVVLRIVIPSPRMPRPPQTSTPA